MWSTPVTCEFPHRPVTRAMQDLLVRSPSTEHRPSLRLPCLKPCFENCNYFPKRALSPQSRGTSPRGAEAAQGSDCWTWEPRRLGNCTMRAGELVAVEGSGSVRNAWRETVTPSRIRLEPVPPVFRMGASATRVTCLSPARAAHRPFTSRLVLRGVENACRSLGVGRGGSGFRRLSVGGGGKCAGEELLSGVATHEPVPDVGEPVLVSDLAERDRELLGGARSEP